MWTAENRPRYNRIWLGGEEAEKQVLAHL